MKSFVKKVMMVAIILATVVDWPVEIDAFNAKPIVKGATLLKSCSRNTKAVEESVNKATHTAEKEIHPAAVSKVAKRLIQDTIRGKAQKTSQSHWVTCLQCNGTGILRGNDGYVYSCSRCNGTGKILVK